MNNISSVQGDDLLDIWARQSEQRSRTKSCILINYESANTKHKSKI
jgi:hypothetical protein